MEDISDLTSTFDASKTYMVNVYLPNGKKDVRYNDLILHDIYDDGVFWTSLDETDNVKQFNRRFTLLGREIKK